MKNNLQLSKIKQYIDRNALLQEGDFVLVGFSGGSDSVALLSILCELKSEYKLTLHALHVNHSIRGEEALRDEQFCKDFCEERKIPFKSVKIDVPKKASEEKLSLEEAGRKARLESFEAYMFENKINKLALAHHKDDLAETCLFNMVRGSKLTGLKGISPIQSISANNGELHIIRPLLCVDKNELLDYLKANSIEYVTDSTNFENDYSRNKIRNLIIPELKEVNTNAVDNIFEMTSYISEVDLFLDEMAEDVISKLVKKRDGRLEIKVEEFSKIHKVLKEKVLYKCLCELAGRKKDIESKHVKLLSDIFEMSSGRSFDLCYGIKVEKSFDTIIIIKTQKETSEKLHPVIPDNDLHRVIPEISIGESYEVAEGICLTLFENMWDKDELMTHIPKNNKTIWFDFEKVKLPIEYRKVCEEDYICVYTDGRKKSLTQLFDSYKIPKYDRDLMCFASGNEVLFVPGLRSCETRRVSGSTRLILEIKAE